MEKVRKIKADKLTTARKLSIAREKEKYPYVSTLALAEKWNCTSNQAYKAIQDYKAGRLTRTKYRSKVKKLDDIIQAETADALLEKQYHKAVAGLEAEPSMQIETRIKLLNSLFDMRKILQQVKLESFMKRADATVINTIIKKFRPDATDDDCVKIYLEAYETCKLNPK